LTQKGILFRKSKPNENNISNEQDNKDNIENYYLFLPLSPHLGILRTIYDSKELSSILSDMNSKEEEKHPHHHEGASHAEHHQLTRINKNYSFGLPLYLPTTTLETSDNKDCENNRHSTKKTDLCRMEYFDLNIFKLLSFFSIDSSSNKSSNYDEIAVSPIDPKHLEEGHKMSTDSSKMDDIDSKKNNEDSKPAITEEQVNCEYHQSIEQIYENCICKNNPTPFDFVTNHIFGKKRSEVKVGGETTKTQERDDLFFKKLNAFLKSTDDISIIQSVEDDDTSNQNNTISSSDSSSFTKETMKEYQEKQLRLIQIQIFLRMQLYVIRGLFVLSAPKEHLSSSPTKINNNIHPNDNHHNSTSASNSVLDQFVQKQLLKKKKKQKKAIKNQCPSISSSTTTTLMNNNDDFGSEDFVDYIASFLSLAHMLFYQSSSSSGQTQSTNSKEEKENFPEQQQSQHTVSQQEKKRSTTNITNTTTTTTRATSTTFESYFEETLYNHTKIAHL